MITRFLNFILNYICPPYKVEWITIDKALFRISIHYGNNKQEEYVGIEARSGEIIWHYYPSRNRVHDKNKTSMITKLFINQVIKESHHGC